LLQAAPKECYEATVPTDVPDDIKAECEDLEVAYVKSVDCPAGVVTRSIFQQYFSYIMATSGRRSRSIRREPPTMGKQLVT
jgi:hypothetical protein